ncbi:MAG: cytochrome P460 family protein [Bryobacteraceae bacterium]
MRTASLAPLFLFTAALCAAEPNMAQPKYTSDNQLIRPAGYREWMFIGSSLGMGYQEASASAADHPQQFHNIYVQPEAYRTYVATGKFPDKTMLVMEVISAGSNASINKKGKFEDSFVGIEAAVKDESKVAEKWAYYGFITADGKGRPAAKAFAKDSCWSCHNQHAEADNVFVQFYPVLRAARQAK